MRLNLGCGFNKLQGWVNVDKQAAATPDRVVDLERFPWPWPDNHAEEVLLSHVLEHLGAAADTYIQVMKELWRVCAPAARITIVVPDPRHDTYIADPTHVRPITGLGLLLFSRKANEEWQRAGLASTPLALYHGVDFELISHSLVFDEPWKSDLAAGRIDQEAALRAAQQFNNVVAEHRFELRVVK